MEKKENNLSTNIEAKNRLLGGILGAIPGALIGGLGGAILSIGAGIFGAKRSLNKADKIQTRIDYENSFYFQHIKSEKEHFDKNDAYCKMTEKECDAYFDSIRELYPMRYEFSFKKWPRLRFGQVATSLGSYRTYSDVYGSRDAGFAMSILKQALVRELDEAKRDGKEITWIKVNVINQGEFSSEPESFDTVYFYCIDGWQRYPMSQFDADKHGMRLCDEYSRTM